jgi:hypothetical protein
MRNRGAGCAGGLRGEQGASKMERSLTLRHPKTQSDAALNFAP